ncbi:MAG: ABC transporter permease [Candidatus Bathyarchaeia archaeon]|jgi:lipooligosaccharide transport system permease protein
MKRRDRIAASFKLPELTYRVWKVWQRNFDVFMKTWKVNFFPPLLEPIFYLVAMGFGLGQLVKTVEGVPYIQFIAPALVAISVMNSSFFECTYGSFVRMYYQKTFDGIIATPISVEEVIAGELLWGATRSLISSTIVLGVVAAFGLISSPLFILILPIAFLGGLMFSSIGMCFTAIAPNIDFFNYPGFLFIIPMFLLSNTFFSLSNFPQALQTFAVAVLPLVHQVTLTRGLMLGNLQSLMLLSIIWIAAVTLFFFILSINFMKKRLVK